MNERAEAFTRVKARARSSYRLEAANTFARTAKRYVKVKPRVNVIHSDARRVINYNRGWFRCCDIWKSRYANDYIIIITRRELRNYFAYVHAPRASMIVAECRKCKTTMRYRQIFVSVNGGVFTNKLATKRENTFKRKWTIPICRGAIYHCISSDRCIAYF